jgi:NHL repeat
MHSKPASAMTIPRTGRRSAVARLPLSARPLCLTIAAVFLVAACGGATGTPTPSAAPSTAASLAPTKAPPTAKPAPTPAPTPLPALTLLWQAGGPKPIKGSTWAPAIDPLTGNVWVAVGFDSVFWIISPDGKYLESWGTPGKGDGQFDFSDHQPTADGFGAIAFAPDGTIFVSDVGNHRVQKFTKDRKFVKAWGSFGSGDGQFAQALEIVTDGKTVYVGDGTRGDIQAFDMDGTFLRSFGASGGNGVFLALDDPGNVYATNPGQGKPFSIEKFDSSGALLNTYSMAFGHGDPVGLSVAPSGHIFVTFNTKQGNPLTTYELDPDGKPIRGWSTAGESLLLAPDAKSLYMAYSNGPAGWAYIQKFALP